MLGSCWELGAAYLCGGAVGSCSPMCRAAPTMDCWPFIELGTYKMEKSRDQNFLPLPQDRVKKIHGLSLKGGNVLRPPPPPPISMAKTSSS